VNCDNCCKWYHPECVGIKPESVASLKEFICDKCKKEEKAIKETKSKKSLKKVPNK